MDGIHTVLMEAEIEHVLTGVPAMFSFVLGVDGAPKEYRDVIAADLEFYERIQTGMRMRGIEYELDAKEPWFLCEAHSDGDIDETLYALRDTLKNVKA
jgi:glutamate-1-semialdehyde 2,1-aminomutase